MSPIIKRVTDFDEGKTFIIEGVFIDYASVFRPNTRYRPEWAVVIRVPQHLVQEFYEVGFRLKQSPEGIVTLRSKRYVRLDDGTEMSPPTIVDCENNPWPEARGLIGNGSRCNVKVRAKYTVYQGVEGLSCFLEGLQVLDHIPYVGGVQFNESAGTTGGWGGQTGFEQPPVQQQPQVPAPQFSAGGYDPQPYSAPPPQAAHQPPAVNPAVPQHMAPAPQPQQGQQYVAPQPQPPAPVEVPQQAREYQPPGGDPAIGVPGYNPPAPVGGGQAPAGYVEGGGGGQTYPAPVPGGNVSQPPGVPAGALGSFGPPADPGGNAPAVGTGAGAEYIPPALPSVGDDVPF